MPTYAAPCNKTANTQLEMNHCANSGSEKEEEKQKELIKKLLTRMSTNGQTKLHKAQKAWKLYRKAQCEFETFGTIDGSINPMVYANCLDYLTKQQNKKLAYQLNCEEYDVSCGNQ